MKIVTSLSFQGQCREAFELYAKVLGGKITAAMPYGNAPPGMPITDEKYKTWLMHCWLQVGDQALMGADMDVGWAPNVDKAKNGFDVTLHTEDKAQGQRWFDQLSEDGKTVMPFGETFWSPGFGSLIDRFGVPWMVNTIPSADWKPPQSGSDTRGRPAPRTPARARACQSKRGRCATGVPKRSARQSGHRTSSLLQSRRPCR